MFDKNTPLEKAILVRALNTERNLIFKDRKHPSIKQQVVAIDHMITHLHGEGHTCDRQP